MDTDRDPAKMTLSATSQLLEVSLIIFTFFSPVRPLINLPRRATFLSTAPGVDGGGGQVELRLEWGGMRVVKGDRTHTHTHTHTL